MAVINSKNANKYSIKDLIFSFFTKLLIHDPKAAQGVILKGQIINAMIAIKEIERNNLSFIKNPEAAMLAIVQAFGLTI